MEAIASRAPRAIAYVACDPAALARDLGTVAQSGYSVTRIRAFDLFPMTAHVECVAIIEPDAGAEKAPAARALGCERRDHQCGSAPVIS